jgi:hypothetical protein
VHEREEAHPGQKLSWKIRQKSSPWSEAHRIAEIQAIFRAPADSGGRMFVWAGWSRKTTGSPIGNVRLAICGTSRRGTIFDFRDLEAPGVAMCHFDGVGAVAAAATAQSDIAAGYDLVLLSKFGKLEAAGDGLASAFRAARVPLLTVGFSCSCRSVAKVRGPGVCCSSRGFSRDRPVASRGSDAIPTWYSQ